MEQEALHDFLTESREGLDRLDGELITLEEHPGDPDTIASIFRIIHTIKGTCGFFGYNNLERVAHVGENLLVMLRERELTLTEAMISSLLSMVDAVRILLDQIEAEHSDDGDFSALITELESHARADGSGSAAVPEPQASEPQSVVSSEDAVSAAQGPAVADAGEAAQATTEVAADAESTASVQHSDEMLEVIQDFINESRQGLDRFTEELEELEVSPGDSSIITGMFRTIHTIKGTSSLLKLLTLEAVTLSAEGLLVAMRDDGVAINEDCSDALLGLVKILRSQLAHVETTGTDAIEDYSALFESVASLHGGTPPAQPALPAQSAQCAPMGEAAPPSPAAGSTVADSNDSSAHSDNAAASPTAVAVAGLPSEGAADVDGKSADDKKATDPKHAPAVAETSVRVDVPLLDSLMTQVGELVLARNQIIEHLNRYDDAPLHAAAQRLNLITSELQEGVMQTRMQPIHSIWAKLPRVVRDLSKSVDKKIRLKMEGKETELDKSLIEAMKDPLTHLVRNSVDHGIEDPATRLAAGKPEEGVLTLKAFHESGQVHIEIKDDGAGVNPEKLTRKAIDRGLVTAEQVEQMTHAEKCKLVFMPGLSTAEAVTNISGRGVGMDVVKTNIEAISGAVDLDSEPGVGTTFKIRVPLTLAIVPALIVTSGSERFALPQANLLELIRVGNDEERGCIEEVQGSQVYRLRGNLLPVVDLNKQLKFKESGEKRECFNMVVLQADQTRFGLLVDEINESQEIVVKPLAEAIRSIPVFAGATIMGDGKLALIVDVPGLAHRSGVLSEKRRQPTDGDYRENGATSDDTESLLLVGGENGNRLAVPLCKVARLEQFNEKQIETTGTDRVIQYRGQIMPLIELSEIVTSNVSYMDAEFETDEHAAELKRVVVFGADGFQTGLVVNEILDVIDQTLELNTDRARHGVLGTAVIQDRVTEVFDPSSIVQDEQEWRDAA